MMIPEQLEFSKILSAASTYAVLEGGKEKLLALTPYTELSAVNDALTLTEEATKLLYVYGIGKIEAFEPFGDRLERAKKGAVLSCSELLGVGRLLGAARQLDQSVSAIADESIRLIRTRLDALFFDASLEEEIRSKIVNDSELSDHASEKLWSIRRDIRLLNERIRAKLSEFLTGDRAQYLQEGIVTMRGDRYVLPVKAEYRRNIRGFLHDRSQSGATVFIEPEAVLELNNELVGLALDEKEEIERILSELSRQTGRIADALARDIEILNEEDALFARAEYAYRLHAIKPQMNAKGILDIRKGRHPLIDPKTVVPVSVSLGERDRFLLISGPNTGGKTVTLKMVGLFTLMAQSGFYVPAAEDTRLSVFRNIYADIGDAQSIEESLSTFSSHVSNLVSIVDGVDDASLVLLDELGGGTDPEEGQALAKAVVSYLLRSGARGIVTTHYTSLKEFAFEREGVQNAGMAFDPESFRPLYRIRIGLPESSNALSISKRLGLKEEILSEAYGYLSEEAKSLSALLRSAEESRQNAQRSLEHTAALEREWQEKLSLLDAERESLRKERERLFATAKAESRRIVNEKTAEAEELVEAIEEIFKKEELTEADLIRARTLKNRVADRAYERESEPPRPEYAPFAGGKVGDFVYLKSVGKEGTVVSLNERRREAEVQCGELRLRCKFADIMSVIVPRQKEKQAKKGQKRDGGVTVVRKFSAPRAPMLEINVLGMTVPEAIVEIDAFLDQAVLANLEEIKIVHGMGTGKLRAGIHAHLKTLKSVAEFRLGGYGEGESGVTVVRLN